MTRDDIMNMAAQAGIDETVWCFNDEAIERFAALVAAEKEQQMIRDGWRKCAEGQRITQFCGLLDAAVKAELEACAELCEEMEDRENPYERNVAVLDCASAIRARKNKED